MKITFSAIVADARGKIGGNVFSRNKSGSFVRRKVAGVQPRTSYQQAVRSSFASLATQWRSLTDAQRRLWNGASLDFPSRDSLGQSVTLSGEQLYVRVNRNLQLVGQSVITSPPVPGSLTSALLVSATATTSDVVTATFDVAAMPAGYEVLIFGSRALSAGKMSIGKSNMRLLGSFDTITANDVIVSAEYLARFGTLANNEGSKIRLSAVFVNTSTGQALVESSVDLLVTA